MGNTLKASHNAIDGSSSQVSMREAVKALTMRFQRVGVPSVPCLACPQLHRILRLHLSNRGPRLLSY